MANAHIQLPFPFDFDLSTPAISCQPVRLISTEVGKLTMRQFKDWVLRLAETAEEEIYQPPEFSGELTF